ncbi:aldehyde dehydrogenase family protein [Streptomyces sp. 35G-GA-8]|uniref:aldehyde dehydrogenase family protein n=1 Tax=Streptomyces sp. 35G-GA-8 TaxID=2939434 RepID=UPI00201F7BE5|nr:aldehyde dehydrogenase family protein [Streptomyces sp. 35G-GA-8]MCL7382296.1 aldehyde dehydrogenase family protein [Streptomyces sp. 35G-GA-8]
MATYRSKPAKRACPGGPATLSSTESPVALEEHDHGGHPVTHITRSRLDTERSHFRVGGAWQAPFGGPGGPHTVVTDPTVRGAVGQVPTGTREDVCLAVAAARAAFPARAAADIATRRVLLAAVSAGILVREADFAEVISAEMSAPLDNALHTQTRLAAEVFRFYADILGRPRMGGARRVLPDSPGAGGRRRRHHTMELGLGRPPAERRD